MAIAQKLAGYTLGKADLLRRAMGKKKKEILDKEYAGFAQGMKDHGYSEAAVKTLWDILLPFSDYAFNRAHSAAYGVVSYWTAFLKANYPAEYMAARAHLASATTRTRPPSTWPSAGGWASGCCRRTSTTRCATSRRSATDIRFGLGGIRNVGVNVVDAIVAARKEKGGFTDFSDFLRKVDAVVCNKKVIESLIKAGAFDSLGHSRKGLLLVHADAIDAVMSTKKAASMGQFDLFGSMDGSGSSELDAVFDVKVPDRASGTPSTGWPSSGRCSGSTSPATRWTGSSRRWPPRRTPRSRRSWRATSARARRSPSAASWPG